MRSKAGIKSEAKDFDPDIITSILYNNKYYIFEIIRNQVILIDDQQEEDRGSQIIMESYTFLWYLAIILISTKVMGIISKKIQLPAVVGALFAGIVLGPSVFNIIVLEGVDGMFIEMLAEVGVILLMFSAGLETDISELKENGLASFVTAIIGVVVPLAGGFLAYALYFRTDVSSFTDCLKAVFIGVVLTATSVSITVETLRELGKLKGRVGTTILGAAVIDDIVGVIVLTIVTSLQDENVSPVSVLMKIVLYFVFIAAVTFVLYKFRPMIEREDQRRRIAIFGVAFCFALSYVSERYFGIADITGAYFAGLMLCTMKVDPYISRRIEIPSYLVFSPVFFASIGIKTALGGMSRELLGFSALLLIVAIATKVLGCGLGARVCRCSNREALQIGVGMVSRGEVALIVAQKGYQYGLLDEALFAPIVLVVIVTTILTPILLKVVMRERTQVVYAQQKRVALHS